jgi:hypothetical protein
MPYRLINPFMSTVPVTSISFVTSAANDNSVTITIPASAQVGDVAVLFDVAENTTSCIPADVIPTDWTGIITGSYVNTSGGNGVRCRISRKILTSGDPGTTITGLNGSLYEDKVMLVFRGNVAVSTVNDIDWALEGTSSNPAAQTVNASTLGTAPLVVLGMAQARDSTAAFSTASPAFDATILNTDSDMRAGYKIYNSSPADHTIDMNDLSDNFLGSGLLEFR